MSNIAGPTLLDQVQATIRVRHYSIRTETAYVDWIKRFILFGSDLTLRCAKG